MVEEYYLSKDKYKEYGPLNANFFDDLFAKNRCYANINIC